MLLGGRAAEEIACDDVSTGAQDDLERATEIARQMVCRFGMSDVLGPVAWGRHDVMGYLPGVDVVEKDYSEDTARTIDAEVKRIVERSKTRAADLIESRHGALDAIAGRLLTRETVDRAELEALAAAA